MRDRLIELLSDAFNRPCGTKSCYESLEPTFSGCITCFADHLLADGWIRLSLKVGDVVYFIYETYDEEGINRCVIDCKVEQLGIDSKSAWFQLKLPLGVKLSGYFRNDKLGKNVFLTREEAEQALKGGEGK